jgi:hypothetical protein
MEPGHGWSILASKLPAGVYSWQKHQESRDGSVLIGYFVTRGYSRTPCPE